MSLAKAIAAQFGKVPFQRPIYASKFYPTAGLGKAGYDLLSVRAGRTDPDDPRATAIALTAEETNLDFEGVLPYTHVATAIRTEIHLLPKARQVAGFSGDADGIAGVAWGVMDKLQEIIHRGILTLTINDKARVIIRQPFVECPPGNGVVVHNLPIANLANQVNLFWASQNVEGKVYEFPELLVLPKGATIKAMLEYPDGAGPSVSAAWTGSLDPYIRLRLYLDGYQIIG